MWANSNQHGRHVYNINIKGRAGPNNMRNMCSRSCSWDNSIEIFFWRKPHVKKKYRKMISKKKIRQKKRCQSLLTFQIHDPSYHSKSDIHEKNQEIQSLWNNTIKDEIKKSYK